MPCPRPGAGLSGNAREGSARTHTQAATGLLARSRQPRHQTQNCYSALGGRSRRRPYEAAHFCRGIRCDWLSVATLYCQSAVYRRCDSGDHPAIAVAVRVDPDYLVANAERWRTFQAAAPGLAVVYVLLSLAWVFAVLGWFVACWGAFRQVHSIGRWRSALAGVMTLVAGVIFFSGLQYIVLGMFGSRTPPLR